MSKTTIIIIVIVIFIAIAVCGYFATKKPKKEEVRIVIPARRGNILDMVEVLAPAAQTALESIVGNNKPAPTQAPPVIPIVAGTQPIVPVEDKTSSVIVTKPSSPIYDIIGTSQNYRG